MIFNISPRGWLGSGSNMVAMPASDRRAFISSRALRARLARRLGAFNVYHQHGNVIAVWETGCIGSRLWPLLIDLEQCIAITLLMVIMSTILEIFGG